MATAEKMAAVEKLTASLSSAKAIYLADFTGVDVASVTVLRRQLREVAVDYEVVKNRLARRAAEAAGVALLNEYLVGPTAMAIATDDAVTPAKILNAFIERGGKLAIKVGYLDGQLLSPEEFTALAKLPSREELLAMVVGGIQSPIYGLVAVLSGLLRNLVGVVAAIEEKQGGAETERPRERSDAMRDDLNPV